jgi:methanogenic corrinoid protein MtbC1
MFGYTRKQVEDEEGADMASSETAGSLLTIAAVERDTGLGKDTLRVWERRYGFPRPERDANGDRLYPAEQVGRLRLVKRLIDCGHRPGRLMQLPTGELEELANGGAGDAQDLSAGLAPELLAYLDMSNIERGPELRQALTQAMMRDGLRRFVMDTAAPLITAAGSYWEHGRYCVYEEHVLTELLQNVLRVGIAAIPRDAARGHPRIVLTTFPHESHGLGLLMAEAILTLEGAQCVSLGVQTPIDQIVLAGMQADVVALSFSSTLPVNRVLDGLADLSQALPDGVEMWCGGANQALRRCRLPGLFVLDLSEAAAQLARWRASHPW